MLLFCSTLLFLDLFKYSVTPFPHQYQNSKSKIKLSFHPWLPQALSGHFSHVLSKIHYHCDVRGDGESLEEAGIQVDFCSLAVEGVLAQKGAK
jgi:hypothetical protein